MEDSRSHNKDNRGQYFRKEIGVDPIIILKLVVKNWYFFGFGLILALIGARLYMSHTMPIYKVSTTVLIYEGEERSLMNNEEILQGLGLPGGMRNLDNQIMILRSRELTARALSELDFDIEYYYSTFRNNIPVYPYIPVRVTGVNNFSLPLPRDKGYSIIYLENNEFILESDLPGLSQRAFFGDTLELSGGQFVIEEVNKNWFETHPDLVLNFIIHSRSSLVRNYNNRLDVELLSRSGSILEISLNGTNRAKDVVFLNKLTEVFRDLSLEKKNLEALRRIQFIDDQLVGISDSLLLTENQLQQFRSTNRVMDLSIQGQAIITQLTELENEKARLRLESNYYDYLADYLEDDVIGELPIVPISMGIEDPGLTRLVTELAGLQEQLSGTGAGEMNPLQNMLYQKIRNTKDALLETLNGLRRANNLARDENQDQIARVNSEAATLPVTERQLLGIERKFDINNEIYTFLLETRSNLQMQKASNKADNEVIDPASEAFASRVAPNPVIVMFLAIFVGCGLPLLVILLIHFLNKSIREEDIDRISGIPIIGNIPHFDGKSYTLVFENPESAIAESYRLMRSRIQFITKDATNPVILVTSPMPGDGKTMTSLNLASVYSMLGKKTVLVGFDLRNPKIYKDFNLSNDKGVSTYLIGQNKTDEIIQKTEHDNLSIISAGPVPPNPSELTASQRTEDLIDNLRKKFDYIIIDSPPIGLISDTHYLTSFADANIIVIRLKRTLRELLQRTIHEVRTSGMDHISLVVNDISTISKRYGYSEKYGYTKDAKRKKSRNRNANGN